MYGDEFKDVTDFYSRNKERIHFVAVPMHRCNYKSYQHFVNEETIHMPPDNNQSHQILDISLFLIKNHKYNLKKVNVTIYFLGLDCQTKWIDVEDSCIVGFPLCLSVAKKSDLQNMMQNDARFIKISDEIQKDVVHKVGSNGKIVPIPMSYVLQSDDIILFQMKPIQIGRPGQREKRHRPLSFSNVRNAYR